jgi:hypothetical protein
MAHGQLNGVLKQIRKLVAAENAGQMSDRQLLELYVQDRDERAFTGLLNRHGAMVLNVCRRVLHNHSDAEDACQVAFPGTRTERRQGQFQAAEGPLSPRHSGSGGRPL